MNQSTPIECFDKQSRDFFLFLASLIQEVTQSNAYMTFESSVKAAFIKYKFNTLINKWECRCYFKYFINRICYCTREGILPWGWERSFTKTARQPPNYYSTGVMFDITMSRQREIRSQNGYSILNNFLEKCVIKVLRNSHSIFSVWCLVIIYLRKMFDVFMSRQLKMRS